MFWKRKKIPHEEGQDKLHEDKKKISFSTAGYCRKRKTNSELFFFFRNHLQSILQPASIVINELPRNLHVIPSHYKLYDPPNSCPVTPSLFILYEQNLKNLNHLTSWPSPVVRRAFCPCFDGFLPRPRFQSDFNTRNHRLNE